MDLVGAGGASVEEADKAFVGSGIVEGVRQVTKLTEEVAEETSEAGEAGAEIEVSQSKLQPILDFFGKIGEIFGQIFTAISDFFKEHNEGLTGKVVELVKGVGSFLTGILDSLGKIFKYIGDKLQGNNVDWHAIDSIFYTVKDFFLQVLALEGINVGAGAVKGVIGKIFGASSIAADIQQIGLGIATIFGTIIALSVFNISEEQIQKYGKYILIGVALIGTILTVLSAFNKSKAAKGNDDSPGAVERVITKGISSMAIVMGMQTIFELLPGVIKAIGDAKKAAGGKDIGVDILLTMVGAIASIFLASIAMMTIAKLTESLGSGGLKALAYAGAYILAVIGTITGILALINVTLDEAGWEELASKAESAKSAIISLGEAVGGVAEAAMTSLGRGIGGAVGGMLGKAYDEVADAIAGGERFSDDEKWIIELTQQQEQLQTVTDAILKLAELMKSEDIQNLKDIFADLSNFSTSGTFGQGLNLNNFSKGFEALATTLVGMAAALTQEDSALFRVMDGGDLEAKLHRTIDVLAEIMTAYGSISSDSVQAIASAEFPVAFDNLHTFFTEGAFTRFIEDINTMLSIVLNTFDMDEFTANESFYNQVFSLISGMSDAITKAGDALDRLKELKGKYSVITKKVAVLKDEFTGTYMSGDTYTLSNKLEPGQKISQLESIYYSILNKREMHASMSDEQFRERYGYIPEDLVKEYKTEIVDPGESLSGVLEEILSVFDHLIEVFESHQNLVNGKYERFAEYFGRLSDAFGMFAGAEGVGSTKWMGNYKSFSDMVAEEGFVEKYVENVEKIYEAFRGSSLAKDDGIIEFNGINIVTQLFEAIQDALDTSVLPSINGLPIVQKIGEGMGIGKDIIAKATAEMIQAGIDQIVIAQNNGPSVSTSAVIPEDIMSILSMATDPTKLFGSGGIESLISEDAINQLMGPLLSSLDDPDGPLQQAMGQLEEKLGKTMNLEEIMTNAGLMFENEEGQKVTSFSYIEELSKNLSDSLNAQEPIAFGVTPVFTLDELTRENLQQQLNGLGLTAPIDLPAVTIDFTALKTELGMDEIKQKLDAIKLAIDLHGGNNTTATSSLGIHMDGIRNEIGNMHMVLDSGILVAQMLPMIDQGLYNRALLEYRSGTSPRSVHYVL